MAEMLMAIFLVYSTSSITSGKKVWRELKIVAILKILKYQTQLQFNLKYNVFTLFVCLFVSLSRCFSGRFNYEGLVPHKQQFAGTLLGMSSCASYISRTHDVINDVTRSQSRSNFESDISPSIFELQLRSKAQNGGNAHGYISSLFNFRYNFR